MCLAIPGRLLTIEGGPDPLSLRGVVDFGGVRKDVSLAFTPAAAPGAYVLVHVGMAISVVDEAEARATLAEIERLGELDDEPEPR
jgi:hydrogenase expression/formation protein HypC